MIRKCMMLALWGSLALPVAAQQVTGVSVGNAPQGADAAPQDESGKAADRGGLASRGGDALQSRHTYQATIGTSIYTPIGTSLFTPVQRPPDSDQPQP